MADPLRRGKEHERAMAKRLGGKRSGPMGRAAADVDAGALCVECKSRKELPAWLLDAVGQAVRSSRSAQLPIVVLHELGRHHDNDLVVMRLQDFEGWHGAVNR